jgi:arylformamidase
MGRFKVSTVYMSTHTGTHVDVPVRFIQGGKGLEEIPLGSLVGPARVPRFRCLDRSISPSLYPEYRLAI